ncbi:UNKNOWN [Stylonychia lemnae]|uniref:HMG box domain-containing protein n=1 Tax=Stylonychia lemnae TaxID=5949 RepID=A0A078BD68_STYLE|nr:UNKNOWN [Stylonychia lemnae]|eukprot:CDW91528.1 UNKNOWN [Stylonychia lemnae]
MLIYHLNVYKERPKLIEETNSSDFQDIMRQLGVRWKEMSEEQKSSYKVKSEEDRLRHQEQSKLYIQEQEILKHSRDVRRGKDGKPKKPRTPYQIFANIVRKKLKIRKPNASESDRMKAVSIEWAKQSPEQKRFYHEESKLEKEKYEKAIEEWNKSVNNKKNKQMMKLDEKMKQSQVSFTTHGTEFSQSFSFDCSQSFCLSNIECDQIEVDDEQTQQSKQLRIGQYQDQMIQPFNMGEGQCLDQIQEINEEEEDDELAEDLDETESEIEEEEEIKLRYQ